MNLEYLIVTPTYSGVARYCNNIIPLLDELWPHHPPVVFLSDARNLDFECVVVKEKKKWTEVLLHGLLSIRNSRPDLGYVLLLLDDHWPLRKCNEQEIATHFQIVVNNQLSCLSFVTYEWPWTVTEQTEYPDGMIRTWREVDLVKFGTCELAKVPKEFFRYFQLQPSFWDLDYLIAVCLEASAKGCLDPWSFEALKYGKARQHYVSRYAWPSVHHGFLAHREINPEAIGFIEMPQGRQFRSMLLKESIGLNSMIAFRIFRFFKSVWSKIARRLDVVS